MKGLLARYDQAAATETVRRLPQILFAREPDAPIVVVGLPPGCGYIATAQNLIHDGQAPKDAEDRAFLMLRTITIP